MDNATVDFLIEENTGLTYVVEMPRENYRLELVDCRQESDLTFTINLN